MTINLGTIAASAGKGLVAGLIGTAAMTLASTVEMKLENREPSDTPAQAAGKVMGVRPRNPEGRERFSNLVHWGYGTSWGIARGLLAATGLNRPLSDALHFAGVWSTALWMLPTLDVSPPPTRWGARALAVDAFHHAVYAAVTGAAYRYLDRAE